MAALTADQKARLDNMCANAAAAQLGTQIDAIDSRVTTLETGEVGGLSGVTAAPVAKYEVAPALGTATATHAAMLLTGDTQEITTGITNPDVPRIVTVKGNDANVAGNVVIFGTDINGDALEETIVANGASEVLGTKAFKTVHRILLPAYAVAGTESISIGRGNKIGLPKALPNAGLCLVKSFDAGAADAGTVTAGATAAATLFAPAGTLNGVKKLTLYFIAG